MDTKDKKKTAAGAQKSKAGSASRGTKTASTSAGGKKTAASAKTGTSGKQNTSAGKGVAAGKRTAVRHRKPRPVFNEKKPSPKRKRTRVPSPEVVYTQPEPFNRNRFLLRLLSVVAATLALFFGMSIFFKVEKVMISGADKYTPWEIREASGIEDGENLLALNEAMISGKIKAELPYVSSIRVGIKLPNVVNIEVTEIAVTYAVESERDGWWLITADGKVMEPVNSIDAEDYTKLLGFQLESPIAGGVAVAREYEPSTAGTTQTDATGESTETTEPVIRGAEQLAVAMDIAQYLEDNGILGIVDYVDVSDMGQLKLKYEERYDVLLGDRTRLGYKIEMMKNTIDQLGAYYSGTLDVSYTLRPQEVVYTPNS